MAIQHATSYASALVGSLPPVSSSELMAERDSLAPVESVAVHSSLADSTLLMAVRGSLCAELVAALHSALAPSERSRAPVVEVNNSPVSLAPSVYPYLALAA